MGSEIPPLGPDQCQVWWARPGSPSHAGLRLLDDVERERYRRFALEPDRARFATAAILMRLLLARHLDLPVHRVRVDRRCPHCGQGHGRPTPMGGDVAVSVSHAADRVAVACGRVPALGVDVEAVVDRGTARRLAPMVLERRELTRRLDPVEFTRYWTRKEAVLKATGDGLRVPMTDLAVAPPHLPPTLAAFATRPDLPARTRMMALSPGPGYEATLAVIDSSAEPDTTEQDAFSLLAREGLVSPSTGAALIDRPAHVDGSLPTGPSPVCPWLPSFGTVRYGLNRVGHVMTVGAKHQHDALTLHGWR
jgi:4'-phosphopantetheinyl transferase